MMVHEKRNSITESDVFHLKHIMMCCLHFNQFYNCHTNTYLIGPYEDQMKWSMKAPRSYLIPSYGCHHFYLVLDTKWRDQNKTIEGVRPTMETRDSCPQAEELSNRISKWNYIRKGDWDCVKVNNHNRDGKTKKKKKKKVQDLQLVEGY